MNILLNILNWFSQNILQNPAFFVGLLVLIGYALLKKPAHDVFAGFIKATVGYLILNAGAAGLVNTFRPILAALNFKFKIGAAVIDPYFGLTAANTKIAEEFPNFVGTATTALLIGFGFNILLVAFRKVTKIRTLFITGHIMVQQAATVSLMVLLLVPQLRNSWGTLAIGLICGLYWAVSSNMTVEATQRLTGGGGFAIGHQQQFAIWFVDKVAPFFGKKEENLDNLKLPKFLSIFHDTVVASATLMLVFFGAILLVLGPDVMANKEVITTGTPFDPAKQDFYMYIIQTAFTFSVYLFILMQGVRMFVSELTNAFQGISSKLLPGSFMVGMVAEQIQVIQSAPRTALFLATVPPASAHLVSATMIFSGKRLRSTSTSSLPTCKRQTVPASMTSTSWPTETAALMAPCKSEWSNATCKFGICFDIFLPLFLVSIIS